MPPPVAYCRPPSAVNISAAASLTGLRVLMATLLTSGSNAWRLREPHRVAKHIGFVSLPLSVVCLRVCYHALRFLSLLSSLASGWLPLRLPRCLSCARAVKVCHSYPPTRPRATAPLLRRRLRATAVAGRRRPLHVSRERRRGREVLQQRGAERRSRCLSVLEAHHVCM